MKKFLAIILSLSLLLIFTGCDEFGFGGMMGDFQTEAEAIAHAEWWDSMDDGYIAAYYRALHKMGSNPHAMNDLEWIIAFNIYMHMIETMMNMEAAADDNAGFDAMGDMFDSMFGMIFGMYQPIDPNEVDWFPDAEEFQFFKMMLVMSYIEQWGDYDHIGHEWTPNPAPDQTTQTPATNTGGFNMFWGETNTNPNQTVVQPTPTNATVSSNFEAQMGDYNQRQMSGAQLLSAIKLFEDRELAIVAVNIMPNRGISVPTPYNLDGDVGILKRDSSEISWIGFNYGALLKPFGDITTWGDTPESAISGGGISGMASTNIIKLVQPNEVQDGGLKRSKDGVHYEGTLLYDQTGVVFRNDITSSTLRSGTPEFIRGTARYMTRLIRTPENEIIGIVFIQIS
jgi:hypothetical protein